MIALIILLIIILLIVYGIHSYNSLQALNVNVDEAESQINIQLQRRADLIPNLVAIVKGYTKYEGDTLTKIANLRSGLTNGTMQEKMATNAKLSDTLNQFFVVAENYPDLKANSNFASLQEELTNTENKVGYARQLFNSCVGTYNRALMAFPGSIIGHLAGLNKRDYLKVDDAVKQVPKVEF